MCKTIKQKVKFSVDPKTIYSLFTDQKKLEMMTGAKALLREKIGSPFSIYNGKVTGVMVDLSPGKRIVQAWKEREFPEGIFSMATIDLTLNKNGGTDLVLTHRGVPKHLIPRIETEWRERFWQKIKKL